MASSALARLCAYLPSAPDPDARVPLTATAAAPVFLCSYAHAILVLLDVRRTFPARLALLPATLGLAYRTAVTYDFAAGAAPALGADYARIVAFNYAYVICMMVVGARAIEWTFARQRYRRYTPAPDGTPQLQPSRGLRVFSDALALLFNQRGRGWSWSRHAEPPRSPGAPPTILGLTATLLARFVVFDTAHHLIQRTRPELDAAAGASIYARARPLPLQALQVLFLCVCAGTVVWGAVDTLYLAAAVPACVLLGHPACAWPPLSDRPWRATSVADFWGRRWHQALRRVFVVAGYAPAARVLGRAGGVLGAFAVSAALHDLGLWGLGRGTEPRAVGGFFVMMGVGALLEGGWERATGRAVRGGAGWVWTMAWTLWWAQFMVDAWARRGFVGTDFVPQRMRLGKWAVELVLGRFGI